MTPRERVMAALNLQPVDKIPFIDWFDDSMRLEVIILKGASPGILTMPGLPG